MKPVLSTSLYDQNVRTVVTFKPMNAMIKPTLRVRPEPFAPRRPTHHAARRVDDAADDGRDGRRTDGGTDAGDGNENDASRGRRGDAGDDGERDALGRGRGCETSTTRHAGRARDDDDDGTDDVRTKRVDADAERWRTNRDGRDDDDDDDGGGVRGGGGYVSGVVFGEEANRERGLGRGAGDGGSGVEEE